LIFFLFDLILDNFMGNLCKRNSL